MPTADLLPTVRAAAPALRPDELAAPLLVGVSGGPDSLALLHALWRWRAAGGPELRAIHVDHGLRAESGAEAEQVAGWCTEHDIPIIGVGVALDLAVGANVEQAAREARYACFARAAAETGARVLTLAHHADDQAETLLLHLLRGAGLAGLAGMPVARRGGDLLDPLSGALGVARPTVWRPLLGVRRAAILAYCDAWGLTTIHDPSNDDTGLRRNAVRHLLLPELERHFPGAAATLARDATLLAADEEYLHAAACAALDRCAALAPGVTLIDRAAFRREPLALQRRILRLAWTQLRDLSAPIGLDAAALEAARDAIADGKTGARHSLPGDLLLIVERGRAALGPAAAIEATLRQRLGLPLVEPGWHGVLPVAGEVDLGAGWTVQIGHQLNQSDARGLHIPVADVEESAGESRAGNLVLRTWQPGDRVALAAARGSRKLQDWLTDRHIPVYARHHLPLLAHGDRILWIVGLAAFPPAALPSPPESQPPPVKVPPISGGFRGAVPRAMVLHLLYNGTPVEPIQ